METQKQQATNAFDVKSLFELA